MGYKREFEEAMDNLREDVSTIIYELQAILDMDDPEEVKLAISDVINTVNTLLEDL